VAVADQERTGLAPAATQRSVIGGNTGLAILGP
jgi:hypothetical protein